MAYKTRDLSNKHEIFLPLLNKQQQEAAEQVNVEPEQQQQLLLLLHIEHDDDNQYCSMVANGVQMLFFGHPLEVCKLVHLDCWMIDSSIGEFSLVSFGLIWSEKTRKLIAVIGLVLST